MLNISNWANQSITHGVRTATKDKYGTYTYTTQTISCRVVYKKQLFRRPNGEEAMSNAIIWSTSVLSVGDKVTLGGIVWYIEQVYPYIDKSGATIGYRGMV